LDPNSQLSKNTIYYYDTHIYINKSKTTYCPGLLGFGFLSGNTPFITHTAAITVFTIIGGFFIDLTNVISAGLRVFKALIASEKKN